MGTRYGPEFVNRLYSSVKRHTKRPTNFYCFTDNINGIDKGIFCRNLQKYICLKTFLYTLEKIKYLARPTRQLKW